VERQLLTSNSSPLVELPDTTRSTFGVPDSLTDGNEQCAIRSERTHVRTYLGCVVDGVVGVVGGAVGGAVDGVVEPAVPVTVSDACSTVRFWWSVCEALQDDQHWASLDGALEGAMTGGILLFLWEGGACRPRGKWMY
jgi:hypothetical protein